MFRQFSCYWCNCYVEFEEVNEPNVFGLGWSMAECSTEAPLPGKVSAGPSCCTGLPASPARAVPAPWDTGGTARDSSVGIPQTLPCWQLSTESWWVWALTYSSGQGMCQRWTGCEKLILQNNMRLCEVFCFLKAETSTVSVIIFVWSPQEACGLTIMHSDCINQ